MDQEMLQTLQEIRGLLYVLVAVVAASVIVGIINRISNIVSNIKNVFKNSFIEQADKYFENAEIEQLIKYCEEKLKKHPNHSNAIWWMAKAKQESGDEIEAKALLERLLQIEPTWKETHIEPYLNKLNSK